MGPANKYHDTFTALILKHPKYLPNDFMEDANPNLEHYLGKQNLLLRAVFFTPDNA